MCKSKGGLTRHTKTHSTEAVTHVPLTKELLLQLINEGKGEAAENKCFPDAIRRELKEYNIKDLNENILQNMLIAYGKLVRNGNIEKYYELFYSDTVINSKTYLPELSQHTSALILFKLADRILTWYKEMKSQSTTASVSLSQMSLSERETHGLKYIGGYIFHKLHKKLKNSKNWKSPVSQQAQSIVGWKN